MGKTKMAEVDLLNYFPQVHHETFIPVRVIAALS